MGIKYFTKKRFIALIGILFLDAIFSITTHAQANKAIETKKSNSWGLLFYKDQDGTSKPVCTIAEWEQKRLQILDSMQMVMGRLPNRSNLPDFKMQVTDSLKGNNYTRLTINFAVAEKERTYAYLYLPSPKKAHEKLPAMLVLHGTGDPGKQLVDGASPLANRALAKELAQRGYIVIAPDYPVSET